MQKQQYVPLAERQRKLQAIPFVENTTQSRNLPLDTTLKGLQLRLSGSVVTTFASGTPVADAFSTFDNIIPRIDVIVAGSRVVKSVRPHMLRMQQLNTQKNLPERKSSAGASAATGNNPTVDAGFTYGTTGQITTAAESVYLPFEMVYCDPGKGRELTWLNLQGQSSAELKLTCASFSTLLGFGNTAPVVYSSSTFQVDVTTVEAQDVPVGFVGSDWKQTFKEATSTGASSAFVIDLPRGNLLSGIALLTRDGAAGSSTTATGKLRNNLVLGAISLRLAGQTEIKATTFLELQSENRSRFGINAAYASNVSAYDGYAYMSLLQRNNLETALNVMGIADQPQLNVEFTSNVSYTNAASVIVQSEEIVPPR